MKNKTKIIILAAKYAKKDGSLHIGGIETYIYQFIQTFRQHYQIVVIQPYREDFKTSSDDVTIIAKRVKSNQELICFSQNKLLNDKDILIVSSEQLNVKPKWKRSLVIQHGVYWDLPVKYYTKNIFSRKLPEIYKYFDNYRNLKRIKAFSYVVCVDYNYSQWFRITNGQYTDKNFWTIPNHAGKQFFDLAESKPIGEHINILFARRFMRFRGTQEFANVASILINDYPNIKITLCGSGPDESIMKKILPASERVSYIQASYTEMPEIVGQHDIIVVPSLGSEGTSLSAIEGMAAGKAVIASAVGGLTNIILNNYNGLLCQPANESELRDAIIKLIHSKELREQIGKNAHETSKAQLSFGHWSDQWQRVIHFMESTHD